MSMASWMRPSLRESSKVSWRACGAIPWTGTSRCRASRSAGRHHGGRRNRSQRPLGSGRDRHRCGDRSGGNDRAGGGGSGRRRRDGPRSRRRAAEPAVEDHHQQHRGGSEDESPQSRQGATFESPGFFSTAMSPSLSIEDGASLLLEQDSACPASPAPPASPRPSWSAGCSRATPYADLAARACRGCRSAP